VLQLKNNTPFSAGFCLFPNEQGIDSLFVIAKATFNIAQPWTLADIQEPIYEADKYWEDPADSSLLLTSDYHIGKAATDIIVIGNAISPDEKPSRALDVDVQVGHIKKIIRVYGDRWWDKHQISSAEYFTQMPMVYERAFGGAETINHQTLSAETRNPIGIGWRGERKKLAFDGNPIANIEDRRFLINTPDDVPPPAGVSPIAPHWSPRVDYVGTYDELWQQTRAPYLPDDYNARFQNVAHPDLIYPGNLTGGEPVRITGMHPRGELAFLLPFVSIRCRIVLTGSQIELPFALETLLIEPNQLRLSLTWRAATVCDKKMLKIENILVTLSR
jgi:hypothetical protein